MDKDNLTVKEMGLAIILAIAIAYVLIQLITGQEIDSDVVETAMRSTVLLGV